MQTSDNWLSLAAADTHLVSYQLTIVLACTRLVTIGRLGQFGFPAGRYVYTGSARRNLVSRVKRHLSEDKILRWHIDYLLAARDVRVVDVNLSAKPECQWNQHSGGVILVPGFGASDCRSRCVSHLKYFGQGK